MLGCINKREKEKKKKNSGNVTRRVKHVALQQPIRFQIKLSDLCLENVSQNLVKYTLLSSSFKKSILPYLH